LGKLDPKNEKVFLDRAEKLKKRLEEKTVGWKKRIQASGIKKVITYHKTLNYFLDRFGIENSAILETKPGVPPTGPHILDVIKIAKDQKVPLIMIENFFDDSVAQRIKADIPTVRIVSIPVSVDGNPNVKTIDDVYETLVKTIEGK
jgi:zinc/manganese transport system substrate-binding protein